MAVPLAWRLIPRRDVRFINLRFLNQGSVRLALGLAGGMVLLTVVVMAVYSTIELGRFDRVESRRAVVVYAAGQTLSRGANVRMIDLAATLGRLGYTETRGVPA